MIVDRLENWALYFARESPVGRAMHYLTHEFSEDTPDGRVDIDGDNIFALIQGYDTIPAEQARFEAHRRHLDIQYIFEGAEVIGWAPLRALDVTEPHDDERDVAFFATPATYTSVEMYAGTFAIFYPGDAHMPKARLEPASGVRKVVVKVRL